MADPNAKPSVDPANEDNLGGVFNTVLRKFLQGVDDMLPARVISYDRDSNRATLQPVVSLLTTVGTRVNRAQVSSVPVLLLGGGGHMLSFNLKPGDFGWIKASDRDISVFMQNFADGVPNTHRMHSFEDALFIPDAMRGFTIPGDDAESVVLQTLDGTYRVALGEDYVQLVAGANVLKMTAAGFTYNGGPFIINGIEFGTHVHDGVESGTDLSGGPQ